MREPEPVAQKHEDALPANLSPSRLADFNQCPRLFYYKTICKVRTPPTFATLKGSLAHTAFERTFDYPEGERTPEISAQWVDTAWSELISLDPSRSEYDLEQAAQAREIVPPGTDAEQELLQAARSMVSLWFEMERVNNFTPNNLVTPTGDKLDGREVYVKAQVKNVPMHGYIDRLDAWQGPEGESLWAVSDYKGLDVNTPLPTPSGWTTMGAVSVGDQLLGSNGELVNVVGKSLVHHRPCFRVELQDGASLVADNVHLWQVTILQDNNPLVDQAVVVASTEDIAAALQDPAVRVFVPWNVLGSEQLSEARADVESYEDLSSVDWDTAHTLPVNDRKALLEHLQRSGDLTGKWQERAWQLQASLPDSGQREIVSVTAVESVPTQCVSVDADDSLYLAGRGFVVTHNTGKLPAPRFQDKYFDQLRIYALLLREQYGIEVSALRLVFTATGDRDKGILTEQVTEVKLKSLAQRAERSWEQINASAEAKSWKPVTGPLCNWCYFQQVCPAFATGSAR